MHLQTELHNTVVTAELTLVIEAVPVSLRFGALKVRMVSHGQSNILHVLRAS